MSGTTKKQFLANLTALQQWANQVLNDVQTNAAFTSLKDKDTVDDNSPLWGIVKQDAQLQPFLDYLAMCGLTVSGQDATAIRFQDFLESMSRSMVQTQQILDSESLRYLAATASQPHVSPTVFRMPKLTAQMRFAMDISQGQTLNLLFYKQDEKTTSRNEQSIDFDLVTTPAPPGAAQAIAGLGLRLNLLLDPFERTQVLQTIAQTDGKDGKVKPLTDAVSADPTSLVILTWAPDPASRSYLVFLASNDNDHSVGLWLVTIPGGVQTIFRYNRNNGPEEGVLRDLVLDLANRQKTFFSA